MSTDEKAGMPRWIGPFLVFVPMALVLSVNVSFFWLSKHDPGFAVEKDYHARGLAWDEEAGRRRASAALGWSLDILPLQKSGERFQLFAVLKDKDGTSLVDASLEIEAFPVARASQTVSLSMRPDGDAHLAEFEVSTGGLWEFRCSARRGEERWFGTVRHELPLDLGP